MDSAADPLSERSPSEHRRMKAAKQGCVSASTIESVSSGEGPVEFPPEMGKKPRFRST